MSYLFPFLLAFVLSFILTDLARRVGTHFGFMARPRRRDVHRKPMPRIGGLAFFLAFLLVSLIFFLKYNPSLEFGPGLWFGVDKHIVGIWLGSLIVVFSMIIDDISGLRAWQKLAFQVAAVLVIIASGIGIDKLSNPFGNSIDLNSVYIPIVKIGNITYHFSLWSDLLTLIWLVGMMNIVNFIDGVDGLAGGITVIAVITIFLLSLEPSVNQPATALLSIILAGAVSGFLIWNFPPAKIFMGDSGSMFLGFMLGILAIISGGKLATAFLVLGFPIVDGVLVTGGRILRGENPLTTPDKTHLHHRFLQAGFSVRQSILALYCIAVLFGLIALKLKTLDKVIGAFILTVLVIVLIKMLNYKIRTGEKKNG